MRGDAHTELGELGTSRSSVPSARVVQGARGGRRSTLGCATPPLVLSVTQVALSCVVVGTDGARAVHWWSTLGGADPPGGDCQPDRLRAGDEGHVDVEDAVRGECTHRALGTWDLAVFGSCGPCPGDTLGGGGGGGGGGRSCGRWVALRCYSGPLGSGRSPAGGLRASQGCEGLGLRLPGLQGSQAWRPPASWPLRFCAHGCFLVGLPPAKAHLPGGCTRHWSSALLPSAAAMWRVQCAAMHALSLGNL